MRSLLMPKPIDDLLMRRSSQNDEQQIAGDGQNSHKSMKSFVVLMLKLSRLVMRSAIFESRKSLLR